MRERKKRQLQGGAVSAYQKTCTKTTKKVEGTERRTTTGRSSGDGTGRKRGGLMRGPTTCVDHKKTKKKKKKKKTRFVFPRKIDNRKTQRVESSKTGVATQYQK